MRVFKEQDSDEVVLILTSDKVVSLMNALDKNRECLGMLETLANETDC